MPPKSSIFKAIRLVVFDFDGVFTDDAVYINEKGEESVRCLRGDGMGIGLLKKSGLQVRVLSAEVNPVVGFRCRKLKLEFVQGCLNKKEVLLQMAKDLKLTLKQVAFVGNDVNDVECLKSVALPIIVNDAHPDLQKQGWYKTLRNGGQGAVREVCDLFIKAKG